MINNQLQVKKSEMSGTQSFSIELYTYANSICRKILLHSSELMNKQLYITEKKIFSCNKGGLFTGCEGTDSLCPAWHHLSPLPSPPEHMSIFLYWSAVRNTMYHRILILQTSPTHNRRQHLALHQKALAHY